MELGKAWNVLRNGHNSHTLLGLGGEITMHIEIEMLNGLPTMMIGKRLACQNKAAHLR